MKKMDEVIKGIKIEMKVHDDVRQRIGNYTNEIEAGSQNRQALNRKPNYVEL